MWQLDQVSKRHHWSCLKYLFTNNHACKIIYKNSLTLTLTLTLTLNHFSPSPLIISLTKIAFNSGDTSLNGIVMGFPPFPAPVSLETAISCPPVAFFGACFAVLLEAAFFLAGFHAPTIDLAHSFLRLWLRFGICCSSGSDFICNQAT